MDRRRLKRHLVLWRTLAVLAVVGAVLLVVGERANPFAGPHVAHLIVSGLITDDAKLDAAVTALAKDPQVKALIVEVDSPGGSVSGGENLHDAIAAVAEQKPVVAVMDSIATSAGYMIAVPAGRIFAQQATLTGSIGVLLPTAQVSGLLDKLGIQSDTIVSGPLKDQPSLTRPLSDEGRRVLQGLVMDLYDQFVAMVAQGRHMTTQQVRALADGRAYTGHQALGLGLIDQIGGEPEARTWLATARGVAADLPIEDVRPPRGWAERVVGEGLGSVLELSAKSLFPQYVSLDGAWAIWHP